MIYSKFFTFANSTPLLNRPIREPRHSKFSPSEDYSPRRKSLSRRLRFAHAEPKGLKREWVGERLREGGGSGWSWAFAVHPVGGTSTTMEIKNAGGKEPGYKSGTTASSRIPGYSRAWKTMPPSRQCALHTASMNFHENYVRIFIPFSSRPSSPAATRFCLLSALPWSRCLLVSGNFRRPSRASFRICLICSFFSFF